MFLDLKQFAVFPSDSDMIQAAVDAAESTGEAVLIPRINPRTEKPGYEISKTVFLPSSCTVYLHNCTLRLADGAVCSIFRNKNMLLPDSLNEKNRQNGITINGIGEAVLDGGKHNGIYEHNGIARKVMKPSPYPPSENCMMSFRNVENMTVRGITVRNHRYWGILFLYCSHCRISDINFESAGNVPNQDGLDICRGCHDFIVENITGCTGDNLIALCGLGRSETTLTGDVYNISIRNVIGHGVGGNALIRILNHDGNKLYNISIDTVIETSPWSDDDAPVAPNPDLLIKTDDEGNILPWKRVAPGEFGYRLESLIQIGESYWFSRSKASHGDTYGISIRNVMTHARFAVNINNTLTDSYFENIRLFGNGFMAFHFGEGRVENIRIRDIGYDHDCHPLPADEHIFVDWNNTRSDGFHCIGFHNTQVCGLHINGITCLNSGKQMTSVIGGTGSGALDITDVHCESIPKLSTAEGLDIL